MKSVAPFLIVLCMFCSSYSAQNIVCPNQLIYMDGGGSILAYDPAQPLSSTNPSNTGIPAFGGGMTLMPNINGGTLSPTFYSTSGGNYYYWDGTSWQNTGHSTGSGSAVNLGGCPGAIYNLVGSSGQVYVYDGTTNGTLLTTLTGFSGGGPYDLTTDCNCNFYALKTSTTGIGQSLTLYNPQGVATASYALINMPHSTAGGGFAIICDKVYLKNNLSNGFFIGTITGASVTFTQVNNFNQSPGDFASCPTCAAPSSSITAQITTTTVSCFNPTANIVVTTTASPVSYVWSGPGIAGPVTGSVLAVNAAGIYTCVVTAGGCPPAQETLTTTVFSNTALVTASIMPSGSVCIPPNQPYLLSVAHSATDEIVTWSGPGMISNPNSSTLMINAQGVYSVLVTDPWSGCTAQDVVTLVESPSVSLALSSASMCALSTNGSPVSVTFTAGGAPSHTFFPDVYYTVNSPNANVFIASPVFNGNTTASGTLVGQNSFCYDTLITQITINANPTVSVADASICPGDTHTFSATGATSYTWSGIGLGNTTGPTVTASPPATTGYSVIGNSFGCFSQYASAMLTLKPLPTITLTPGATTICLGSTVGINAQGTATSYTWVPSANLNFSVGAAVVASPPSSRIFSVTGSLDDCISHAIATVVVQVPPSLSITLSSPEMCHKDFNGSVNTITLIPSGATNYTLLQGAAYVVNNPFGSAMQLVPTGPPIQNIVVETATLIGNSGVCTVSKTQTFSIIPNPVLQVSPPSASICPGGAQVYQVSGASIYTWLPSPGILSYTAGNMIAKPKNTSFFAVYGASLGCNSDYKNAVLVVKPVPQLTVAPVSATVCEGGTVTIAATGNASSYSWSPSGSLSASTGATVVARANHTQEYTVVASLNSCTNVAVSSISAIAMPTISAFASNSVICSAGMTNLQANGAMSYSWMPPSTLKSDEGSIVQASPNENTTYTVWGYNGICSGSTSVLVRTIPRPDLEVFTEGGQNTICFGEALGVMTSGAQHYEWHPAEYVRAIGSNSAVIVKPPVTTNFTIMGANFEGTVVCPYVVNYSVIVVPKSIATVAGNNTICLGERTTLQAKGGTTFRWYPGEGLNNDAVARVVASPTASIIYTVEASQGTYCGGTTTIQVHVNPRPQVFAGRDTAHHVNDVILLNATGSGSITWVSGEGIACPGCASTQVYPSHSGCYLAETVNEFGCTHSDDICLEISRDFNIYVPNSFTPNGDGLNDVFLVYGENFYDAELQIFDRWGQLLFVTDDVKRGWDGTHRGKMCKVDSYVYKLRYTGLDRKAYHRTGIVTIVR